MNLVIVIFLAFCPLLLIRAWKSLEPLPPPLLLRALRGERVERIPVWLMRQAGRYMPSFREYSEKYSFRERSETPEIATILSLQPWKRFGVDGVIMFSDILTPLAALGVDFQIDPGTGPKIRNPIRSSQDIENIGQLHDVNQQLPFISTILQNIRREIANTSTLIGFIGAPWTLAAYSVEGGHSKQAKYIKMLCIREPLLAHKLLQKYASALCTYVDYQVEHGAQVIQIFESWAHHLSENMFDEFAKPYANEIAVHLKQQHPNIPVVYFANGGSFFLEKQLSMDMDALSIDWKISMATARQVAPEKVLAGNVDPTILYCNAKKIKQEVETCIRQANGRHVLNLGHGIEPDMTENSVEIFVQAAKNFRTDKLV